MKIVFIAGPYRGDRTPETIERNIAVARQYQRSIAEAGIVAYSPNVHDAYWEGLTPHSEGQGQQTLKTFTDYILKEVADALVVIPGWESSEGTKDEIAYAQTEGLPIFFPKDPQDLSALLAWYRA